MSIDHSDTEYFQAALQNTLQMSGSTTRLNGDVVAVMSNAPANRSAQEMTRSARKQLRPRQMKRRD